MKARRPAHIVQTGNVQATIWRREERNETTWFHVGVSRFDSVGGRERYTNCIRPEDKAVVKQLMEAAFEWIAEHLVEPDPK